MSTSTRTEYMFEVPETRQTGIDIVYTLYLKKESYKTIPVDMTWTGDFKDFKPDIRIQSHVNTIREQLLFSLVANKDLFTNPPTFAKLQLITPVWGITVRNNIPEWSSNAIWKTESYNEIQNSKAIVQLTLIGIEISRQSILPLWSITIVNKFPENKIAIQFGDTDDNNDEIMCIDSSEIMDDYSESGHILCLKDVYHEKKQMKEIVRNKMREALNLYNQFMDKYGLTDDDSDFSDFNDSEDSDVGEVDGEVN